MHPRLRRAGLGIFLALMLLTTMPACGVRQLAKGEIQPPKVTFQGLKIYQPHRPGLAPGRQAAPGESQLPGRKPLGV